MKRLLGAMVLVLATVLATVLAPAASARTWEATLAAARGQTVYWHAWGGDVRTNEFIAWLGAEAEARHGVRVEHVKLSDTAEAVTRVVAERAAGRAAGGAVDLIWINGPNFLSMKQRGLLYGPFLDRLPNARFLDRSAGAAAVTDFTVPTEGYESPWRLARFVLTHDSARVPDPPRDLAALAAWAQANPGRFTHPVATNFMGATFLKQALVALAPDPAALRAAPTDASYVAATAPLWAWYDALRPHLWRGGATFPENEAVQQQLLNDGEVDFTMAFDPAAAAAAVERGLLPAAVRSYALDGGTLGNVSFVAIPFNASAPEGAMVVANLLLDPAVQARAQDIRVLGAFSVLDPARLDATARAAFDALPAAPALPTLDSLGPTLPEPHPDWMTRLAEDWARRVAR
jgi:putative thiamine transport system substrate-binding protein